LASKEFVLVFRVAINPSGPPSLLIVVSRNKHINMIKVRRSYRQIKDIVVPHDGQTPCPASTLHRAINGVDRVGVMISLQKIELCISKLSFYQKEDLRIVVGNEQLKSSNCPRVAQPLTVPG
jgi:hypothetical protein